MIAIPSSAGNDITTGVGYSNPNKLTDSNDFAVKNIVLFESL
jgi:hypothetical protein